MEVVLLLLLICCSFFSTVWAQNGTAALEALVQRQLPFHNDSFVFHLAPQQAINIKTYSELDTFTLFDANGKINIECSTTSACARGLYTYLPRPIPFLSRAGCVVLFDSDV